MRYDIWTDRNWMPMLLEEKDKPFDSNDYIYEIKFDGMRAVICVNKDDIKIYNRRNKDITCLFPEFNCLKNMVNANTIFDGEIIVLDNGYPSFTKLQERIHLKDKNKIQYQLLNNSATFMCFDILYEKKDLTNLALYKRKSILEKYKDSDYFVKTKYIEKEGVKLFQKIKKYNLEGIIAKNKNSVYKINNRSDDWIKIKNYKEKEFFIGGYLDIKSNHVISLLLGEKTKMGLNYVGKVSLGKKKRLYEKIKKEKVSSTSFFSNFNDSKYTYVKPIHKCKVKYLEKTKNNKLRQPFI